MSSSVLTPFRHGQPQQVGPRLFRKQLLPLGKPIRHKGQTLVFDRAYLEQVAENFRAGAYDQVPAVLADDDNRHNENPENFRGEVKAVELTQEGLDVVVEMTERGAQLIAENPRLGVSARLVPEVERADGRFENVLRHVCLTMSPKANGMRAWETVSTDSVLSASQDGSQTLDFSDAIYPDEMPDTQTLTDEQLDSLKGLSPDERATKVRELLGEMTVEPQEPKKEDEPKGKFSLRRLFGIEDDKVSDEDIQQALSEMKVENDDQRERVAATLSDDDRRRIDLAEEKSRKADEKVAAAEWKLERKDLTEAGVPPAMLDLAEPILKSGQEVTIDLSDDQQADASEVIRKLLHEAKGTVDLSDAHGSSENKDREAEAKDLASDEKWGASV